MKKKKVAVLLYMFLIVLFMGCDSSYRTKSSSPRTQKVANARYDITMIAVEKSVGSQKMLEEQRIETVVEGGITRYRSEDNMVRIEWRPAPVDIEFTVNNKTDSPIKIVWDEASFVDEKGISHRLIHSGIGYEERKLPQPPTVIVGGINLQDFVHPLDYFQWKEIRGMRSDKQQGYWDRTPFLPTQIKGATEELRVKAGAVVGKTFQVILPLEISNIRIDYLYTFRITNVDITEGEEQMERNSSGKKGSGRTGKRLLF
jgi:hypothetical protein